MWLLLDGNSVGVENLNNSILVELHIKLILFLLVQSFLKLLDIDMDTKVIFHIILMINCLYLLKCHADGKVYSNTFRVP